LTRRDAAIRDFFDGNLSIQRRQKSPGGVNNEMNKLLATDGVFKCDGVAFEVIPGASKIMLDKHNVC